MQDTPKIIPARRHFGKLGSEPTLAMSLSAHAHPPHNKSPKINLIVVAQGLLSGSHSDTLVQNRPRAADGLLGLGYPLSNRTPSLRQCPRPLLFPLAQILPPRSIGWHK
jgi:hypothetical protein